MRGLKFWSLTLVAGAVFAAGVAVNMEARAQQPAPKTLGGPVPRLLVSMTIKGYVIDSACTFTKQLKKPISPECAIACAKAGSPLVIQTTDGTIYWPISGDVPASGQNDKLMPYAGKMVLVTGKIYKRGGSRAIVIESIKTAGSQ